MTRMIHSQNEFPLRGESVAAAIVSTAEPHDVWLLSDIETLSDIPAASLGNLWQALREGPVKVRTADLCAALALASQVISLDIRLESEPSVSLLVEDGRVVAEG